MPAPGVAAAWNSRIMPSTVPSKPIIGAIVAQRAMGRMFAYSREASRSEVDCTVDSTSEFGRPTLSSSARITFAVLDGYCWQSLYARRGSKPPGVVASSPSFFTNFGGTILRRRKAINRSSVNPIEISDRTVMGYISGPPFL